MRYRGAPMLLALALLAAPCALWPGCLLPVPRGPRPQLSRQCTPDQQRESFQCRFFGFEMAARGEATFVGGGNTECDCIRALAHKADAIWQDGGEAQVLEPCRCTIKR